MQGRDANLSLSLWISLRAPICSPQTKYALLRVKMRVWQAKTSRQLLKTVPLTFRNLLSKKDLNSYFGTPILFWEKLLAGRLSQIKLRLTELLCQIKHSVAVLGRQINLARVVLKKRAKKPRPNKAKKATQNLTYLAGFFFWLLLKNVPFINILVLFSLFTIIEPKILIN